MNEFHICIIIINWNGYQVTRENLISIQKITYTNYRIILVDNGSVDDSARKLLKEFAYIDIVELENNYGFTGGNNKGIEYAKKKYNPDYFLLLNNDTEVKIDFLDKLIRPFLTDETIYATVPKIYYYNNKNTIWYAGGKISRLSGIVTEFGRNKKDSASNSIQRKIGFMNGCAVLLSAKTINDIGLLDEMFFAYSEDTDYSIRIIKSGHSIVYVPESIVYHKVSHSFNSNNKEWFKYYLATRNIIFLQRKHLNKKMFPVFILWFSFRWLLYLYAKLIIINQFKSARFLGLGFYDGLTNTKRFNL